MGMFKLHSTKLRLAMPIIVFSGLSEAHACVFGITAGVREALGLTVCEQLRCSGLVFDLLLRFSDVVYISSFNIRLLSLFAIS